MTDLYRLAHGPAAGQLPAHAWPGGYPLFYIVKDGGILCPDCANMAEREGLTAVDDPDHISVEESQWHIIAQEANYEDPELFCDHCYARIESAYAEEEANANRPADDIPTEALAPDSNEPPEPMEWPHPLV